MKIYLDIDETLVTSNGFNTSPADHLKEFLEYMTKNHEVYWLTTHCNGIVEQAVDYMSKFVSPSIISLTKKIKPTKWDVLKSDAINMGEDFLWFDDTLSCGDEEALKKSNKLGSFVKVNLKDNPSMLLEFIEKPNCKAYVIDILKKSYMLHIWTWPKFSIGWHKKIDGPNKRIFWIYKWE